MVGNVNGAVRDPLVEGGILRDDMHKTKVTRVTLDPEELTLTSPNILVTFGQVASLTQVSVVGPDPSSRTWRMRLIAKLSVLKLEEVNQHEQRQTPAEMIKSTQIARLDGLMLCASIDDEATENALTEIKSHVKMVLRRLNRNSEPQASIESGAYTLHIVYIAICERSYPRKLAFTYLSDLSSEFSSTYTQAQLSAPSLRPYAFMEFDTFIQRTKATRDEGDDEKYRGSAVPRRQFGADGRDELEAQG
ncbi:hypothetical protein V491_04764 [Pseudogymnoascus sp. VKM F-3775]|nr:hypothetical protein V491_04764 [Pseudogymnoascus sp. VKM F-3775]